MSAVVAFTRSQRLNKFVSTENPGSVHFEQYRGQNTGRIHGIKWNFLNFKKFAKNNESDMNDFVKNHKFIQALECEHSLIALINIDSIVLFGLYVDQLKKIKTKHLQAKKVPGFESFLDYIFLRTIELYSVNPQCKDWEYHSKVFAAMLPKMEQNGKVVMFSSSVRKMIDEIENIKLYGL
jgi:hypothetical protein